VITTDNERIRWLAGTWDLVESTFTTADGTVTTPWGAEPSGVLMVTPTGELSAHGGRSGRAHFSAEHPTPAEKQQAYDDYFSYFARIVHVDDEAGTILNAIDGATNPDWIGGEQLRYLDIADDDNMVLRTPPLALGDVEVVARLVWKRRRSGPL
jgi:hypothetical protein